KNVIALIEDDQPALAEREIRHFAEPIPLIAHAGRDAVLGAEGPSASRETTPSYDPEAPSAKIFKAIAIAKGDLAKGFAAADAIVEGEYRAGHQEQLYIEPNGVIAVPEAGGAMTVYGSMECPYYAPRTLKVPPDLPAEKVRVVQTET